MLSIRPLLRPHPQTTINQLPCLTANLLRIPQLMDQNVTKQLCLTAPCKWKPPTQHRIQKHSKCPYIRLENIINLLLNKLRTHIIRRPTETVAHTMRVLLNRKSKINYLDIFIRANKNIIKLYISMRNFIRMAKVYSRDNLSKQIFSLALLHNSIAFQITQKWRASDILSDYMYRILRIYNFP